MDKNVTKIVSQMAAMDAMFASTRRMQEPIKGSPGSTLSKAEQAKRKTRNKAAKKARRTNR